MTDQSKNRYINLVVRDGWEFAQRVGRSDVVCVVPITTDGQLILVEQFRPPLDKFVVELPAGLVGDLTDQPDETLQQAAERELLEETGYVASDWCEVVTAASSAGLTDEVVTFFLARNLERKTAGGGDETEEIRVHSVLLTEVESWLDEATAAGKIVDLRIYAAIRFATRP